MPNKFDYAHMEVAEVYAHLSSATRLKVGSIIVKDNKVISIGYNGMPSGWDNNCENFYTEDINGVSTHTSKTKQEVIHAEMNSLGKLARAAESGENATMYVTHAPCFDCAKLIHVAGIKKVFYRNQYRNTEGLDFLNKCKIEVEKI